jgi:amicyanin
MQKSVLAIVIVLVAAGIVGAVALSGNNKDNQDSLAHQNNSVTNETNTDTEPTPESAAAEPVATKEVNIVDFAFTPSTIKVKVGDTVTWTNQDSVQHDVVSDDGSADGPKSELLAKGDTYKFTFKKAGTFKYHCNPHPQMQATVIVE